MAAASPVRPAPTISTGLITLTCPVNARSRARERFQAESERYRDVFLTACLRHAAARLRTCPAIRADRHVRPLDEGQPANPPLEHRRYATASIAIMTTMVQAKPIRTIPP